MVLEISLPSMGLSFYSLLENETFFEVMKATTTITLIGNVAILLFTYIDISSTFLKRMVAFAIGGLLGDVFLHLIPHAIMSQLSLTSHDGPQHNNEDSIDGDHHHHEESNHGHDHHHDHSHEHHDHDIFNSVGLYILGGIFVFFFIEKLMQILCPGHSHSHSSNKQDKTKQQSGSILQPSVILNLVGDFTHNFTDGLALAAAFQISPSMGQTMTYAVALHEIPHEFGDFAVLLNNGISKGRALALQFVSALGAYLGCIFGMLYTLENPSFVLATTAGGFIYIATTSLLGDLIEQETSIYETIVHLVCISLGVYSMLLIGEFEESMEHIH